MKITTVKDKDECDAQKTVIRSLELTPKNELESNFLECIVLGLVEFRFSMLPGSIIMVRKSRRRTV